MNKRPLVNTRDEPHADARLYRRFHVIIGDSNMSEWATALKAGTTALVLELIERGEAPQIEIAQPIDATKSISRDQNYDWIIELSDGRKISAIDVQRLYLNAAQQLASEDAETIWLLREWETVLNDLARDVALPAIAWTGWRRKCLLTAFREAEKLSWTDPWLQSIDLEYHNVFRTRVVLRADAAGTMRSIVSEEEIKDAIFCHRRRRAHFFAAGRSRNSTTRSLRSNGTRSFSRTARVPI